MHSSEAIEGTVRANPDLGVWVVIDVDFQNAFPSLLREAMIFVWETKVPQLRPWSKRCQDNCGVVCFPSGDKRRARRGFEQGDPLEFLQFGCVIADVAAAAMADMRARKDPDSNL